MSPVETPAVAEPRRAIVGEAAGSHENPGASSVAARKRRPSWLVPALVALAFAVWLAGVHRVDPTTLDAFGLVSHLSPLVWLGYLLLVVAAVLELGDRVRSWVLTASCIALVVMIYGLQALSYGAARLPIGWLHVGFANQILQHGEIVHFFDTRFSWPGFFTTAAFWSAAAGFDTTEPLIKWAPVVLLGLAAVSMHVLARAFLGAGRGAWIATLLFIASDWTEQDYFSPQGLAYVMLLAALAIAASSLVPSFTEQRGSRLPWRRSTPPNRPGERILAQFSILVIAAAMAPSHQLTPFMLAGFLFVFWLFGRLSSGWLPVMTLLLPVAWFILGAQEFWLGQLGLLTNGAGDLGSSLNQGIAGRVAGSVGHETMVVGRIALTVVLGISFLVSLWLLRRRQGSPWLLVALVVAAFGMAVIQPYGGEIFMRCFLFALPWFVIAIGRALDAFWDGGRARLVRIVTGLLIALVCLTTVTLRGGNDAYVAFDSDDVVAVKVADQAAQPGDSVIAALWYVPLRLADVNTVVQVSAEELASGSNPCLTEDQIYHCLVDQHATFVVLTPAQEHAGEVLSGFPAGWMSTLQQRLESDGHYRVIYDHNGRVVLEAQR